MSSTSIGDVHEMGAVAVVRDVIAPVRNAPGQRRRAGALLALGIGARAQHRVAVDHGGGFHPGAMLALHRHVADLVGRAGREHVDAAAAEEFFALLLLLGEIVRNALDAPLLVVDAGDELTGIGHHPRHLDDLGTVEIEFRIDRVKSLLDEFTHRRRRGVEGARDIVGLDQAFGAERFAIANQQVHRARLGAAVRAVEHRLLVVGQFHRGSPPYAVRLFGRDLHAAWLGHLMCLVSTLSRTRSASAAMSIWCTLPVPARSSALAAAAPIAMHGPITRTLDSAGIVGIDAASGGHDVVAFGGNQAAERNIMDVVGVEGLPDVAGAMVVQFDRPCGARDRIGEFGSRPHVIDRQLLPADDPSGLANAREAIGADPRIAETFGNSLRRNVTARSAWSLPSSPRIEASIGSSGVSTWVMFIAATPRPGMMKASPSRRTSP